jgi:hypothetical protein
VKKKNQLLLAGSQAVKLACQLSIVIRFCTDGYLKDDEVVLTIPVVTKLIQSGFHKLIFFETEFDVTDITLESVTKGSVLVHMYIQFIDGQGCKTPQTVTSVRLLHYCGTRVISLPLPLQPYPLVAQEVNTTIVTNIRITTKAFITYNLLYVKGLKRKNSLIQGVQ